MKNRKLSRLFQQASADQPPAPHADFPADVMRAIRTESPLRRVYATTLLDALGAWFPRLAWAAAAIIALCAVTEFSMDSAGVPDVIDSLAQASTAWPFDINEL